jgi:hypothetical protein
MGRLNESEWRRLLPHIQRLKQHRRDAAYQHLVKGVSLASAGEPHGMSRQNVFHVIKTVEKYLERMQASQTSGAQPLPKGWVRLEVAVPRRLVDTARRLVSALAENNGDVKPVKSRRARKP